MAAHLSDMPAPAQSASTMSAPALSGDALTASLAEAADKNHALVRQMVAFARDESLRLFQRHLERGNAAMGRLQDCQGIGGLIGVHRQWLHDLIQDYADENMRVAGLMQRLAQDAIGRCAEAAQTGLDGMSFPSGGVAAGESLADEMMADERTAGGMASGDMPSGGMAAPMPAADTAPAAGMGPGEMGGGPSNGAEIQH